MPDITAERAAYTRDRSEPPRLLARTPGIPEHLFARLSDILVNFGERPAGVACPGAVFAQPVDANHVAAVHVKDAAPGSSGWAGLQFDVVIVRTADYELLGADPFSLIRVAASKNEPLQPLVLPAQPIAPRGLAEVQAVLKRVKANALPDNFDPKNPPPLTVENSESPMLLGGVQILVDGGKLVFERPKPDASVIEGLWALLPYNLRSRIWPATFAFSNDLGFDVLVVPKVEAAAFPGYTTEDAAGDYPPGSYELALQTAAEGGSTADLEAVFRRRTSNETLKLAVKLLIGMSLLVVGIQFFKSDPPTPDIASRAAFSAGIVGVKDPWAAKWLIDVGNRFFLKREFDEQ